MDEQLKEYIDNLFSELGNKINNINDTLNTQINTINDTISTLSNTPPVEPNNTPPKIKEGEIDSTQAFIDFLNEN